MVRAKLMFVTLYMRTCYCSYYICMPPFPTPRILRALLTCSEVAVLTIKNWGALLQSPCVLLDPCQVSPSTWKLQTWKFHHALLVQPKFWFSSVSIDTINNIIHFHNDIFWFHHPKLAVQQSKAKTGGAIASPAPKYRTAIDIIIIIDYVVHLLYAVVACMYSYHVRM